MKLVSFRITDYRCINDSGEVGVDPKVTCLVGKNESGKTGLLQGLRRANPLHPARFDQVQDFPRNRLRQYERELNRNARSPATVVVAKFVLTDDDVEAVELVFCPGVLSSRTLVLEAGYGAAPNTSIEVNEPALLRHLARESANSELISGFATLAEAHQALSAAGSEDPESLALAARLQPFLGEPLSDQVVTKVLRGRTPKFLYFDDYSIMAGKAPLSSLLDESQLQQSERLRTLKELLDLAGTSAQELADDANYEHHKASLEATANEITREVFDYWRQNQHLEVEFDVHRSQQEGKGAQATFHVRIENRRHGVTVPFDERSRGFVWFFSFLVAFNKVVDRGEPVIILLDEPGLNLHGKAQADLLRFFEERLAPHHQVIYSTHSPFMVDAHRLDRVRTVEDVDGHGTRVSADCLTRDADTLFPLQAALGYDVAQSLFIGPNCLLVEGPSDLIYLQAMSRVLSAEGRSGLDDRWVITPVGGADKLAAFVALMGASDLNLAVLLDIAKKDQQRVDNLVSAQLLDRSRILKVAQFADQAEADIEDLLPEALYVDAVRRVLGAEGASLSITDLPQDPRIVKRIERAIGRRFDHYAVAVRLLPELNQGADAKTVDRFARLFEAVNALLPRT